MDKETFQSQLTKLTEKEDTDALAALIESLSPTELAQYKDELIEAYDQIYSYGYYDLMCHKIGNDPERFVFYLLDILAQMKKLDPERSYTHAQADCYGQLSSHVDDPEKKLAYTQQAIDIYTTSLQEEENPVIQAIMINALLDKMEIQQDFSTASFTTVYQYFQAAATAKQEENTSRLLHACFRILAFPFDENEQWHQRLFAVLQSSLYDFAAEYPIVHLSWCKALVNVLEYNRYDLSPVYAAKLNIQTIELLEPITDYETTHKELLNQLGDAFAKAAQRMPDEATAEKLRYYGIAVKYFTKGQTIDPATWTFPVYATNALMAMARMYDQQGFSDQVTDAFETGKQLFAQVHEHGKDFTLNLYWGNFLLEYARLDADFTSTAITGEAEEKLLLAKELGNKIYAHPYLSLAKLALKTGNKQQCLDILQECKTVFSTEHYTYDMDFVFRDEDFREIWAELG